jgi:hypothetical protein
MTPVARYFSLSRAIPSTGPEQSKTSWLRPWDRCLLQFPAYSPELNPDEWVWKNVKADRTGRASIDQDKGTLRNKAVAAMRRLQKLSYLVRGFFDDPNLRYIAA